MIRRGFSTVITTSIIFAILMIAIILSIWYSYGILESHAEVIEYENGKNDMLYLSYVIEKIASDFNASTYLRFNTRVSAPSIIQKYRIFKVRINNQVIINDTDIPIVLLKSGSLVTDQGTEILRGTNQLVIIDPETPLTLTYTTFDERALIIVDPVRIRVTQLGVFKFYLNNGSAVNLNVVNIDYIRLKMGKMGGSGVITLYLKNIYLNKTNIFLPFNDFTITATQTDVNNQTVTEIKTITGEIVDGTLIIFSKSIVEVSTVPG